MTATINASTSAGVVTTADTSGILQLQTNGTAALTVDASQNTTIAGTLTTTGVTTFAAGSAAAPAITTTGDTNTGIFFPAADTIAFSEGGAEAMRIDSSGQLGIGTTAPSAKLHVESSAVSDLTEILKSTDAVNGRSVIYMASVKNSATTQSNVSMEAQSVSGANADLVFRTNGTNVTAGTECARIASTGNVTVGSPVDLSYKMALISTSTSSPPLYLRSTAAGDAGTAQLRLIKFTNTNTTSQIFVQFVIDANGTNSGQINANGASQAAFGSFSDVRLKENIVDLPLQLSNIMALRPVEFDYKDGCGHQIGFIAQEMEQVYPDAIGVGENEMLTITGWSKTEARLVKAIQEQQALITALTTRITALENNNATQ